MKKVYVSDVNTRFSEFNEAVMSYDLVPNIEDSTDVIVAPGGMAVFSDIFKAIELKKDVYLYNKDLYFSGLINNLHKGHEEGYIEKEPSGYMHIESNIDDLVREMEAKEDGINNGKSR